MNRLILVLLVLSSGLSGCVGGPDAPGSIHDTVHSFKAVYSLDSSSRDWVFELHPPVEILDRDFQHRHAYPLTITPTGENQTDTIVYLDEELRVVRESKWCLNRWFGDECTHATTYWDRQGALPPLGFFWPHHLAAGGGMLEYSLWLSNLSVEPEWTESPENGLLVVPDDAWPRAAGWLAAGGEYRYSEGMQVPDRVVREDKVWEMVSYEEGEGLPRADVWPKSTKRPVGAPRDFMMFPGEDEDPYGLDSPPLQALEWLLDNEEEAAELMDQGCIQRSEVWVPEPYEPVPLPFESPLTLFNGQDVHHIFSIVTDDGKGKQWTVRHVQDPVLGESYSASEPEDPPYPPTTACLEQATSPAPSMTSVEAWELLGSIPVSDQGNGRFSYRFYPIITGGEGARLSPPEDGWDVYSLLLIPSYVDTSQMTYGYKPYIVEMSASSEYLRFLRVHPDDLRELDENWTPPPMRFQDG